MRATRPRGLAVERGKPVARGVPRRLEQRIDLAHGSPHRATHRQAARPRPTRRQARGTAARARRPRSAEPSRTRPASRRRFPAEDRPCEEARRMRAQVTGKDADPQRPLGIAVERGRIGRVRAHKARAPMRCEHVFSRTHAVVQVVPQRVERPRVRGVLRKRPLERHDRLVDPIRSDATSAVARRRALSGRSVRSVSPRSAAAGAPSGSSS